MKKHWKKIVAAVIAALVILCVGGLLGINQIARWAMESEAARALGVPTTVDTVHVGIVTNALTFSGLQVANPEGFTSNYFLRLEDATLDASLFSLLGRRVEIQQMTLRGLEVNLVREQGKANFRPIIEHLREFQAQKKAEEQAKSEEARKKFLIHEVLIQDILVHADLLPIGGELTQLKIPIDELSLEDVGSEGINGESLARVTATIVRAVLDAVLAKGENVLPPELRDELIERLQQLHPLETLQELRERIRERRATEGPIGPLRRRRMQREQRRESEALPTEPQPPPPMP